MDTTEQYIKMCEKAMEIRVLWKPDGGDFYFDSIAYERRGKIHGFGTKNFVGVRMRYCSSMGQIYKGQVWLPRQDQLQEMVNYAWKDIGIEVDMKLWRFHHWVEMQDKIKGSYPFTSMEQLWLAFVMKEKYNKVWNGEDWVK